MVQVDRPVGQVEVGRSSVDSQAITEEAITAGESAGFEPSVEAQGFSGADTIATDEPDSLPGAVPPDWQSDKTRRSRQIALVVALSASGLLLACAVFGWFVHSWGTEDVQSAPMEVAEDSAVEPENSVADVTSGDSPATQDPSPDNVASLEPESDPAEPLMEADPSLPGTEDPSPTPGDVASVADTGPSNVEASPQEPESPAIPNDLFPQSVLEPLSSNPMDALNSAAQAAEGQPSQVDSVDGNPTAVAADEVDEADEAVGGMQDLPPELEKYTRFLLGDVAQKAPTLDAPPMMEDIKVDDAAEEKDNAPVPLRRKTLNLKADLAIRLALASDGYPMSDLVLLIGQVSGVPIQMDWVSFDLAGIDVATRVPTQKAWRTAKEILDDAATTLGAEFREEESLLVLTLTDQTFNEAVENITNLDDFGAGKDSAREALKLFLAGADDGDVRQAKQLEALATEALRRMRQIQPKMADDRMRRWACVSNDSGAEWSALSGGDAGPQIDSPIAIAGFLRRTARLNQATCLFNWYDANRRGAVPERLVLPHAGPDAAITLERLLTSFGLQARQTDTGHWWVGTEATYDRLPIVVWTPPLGDSRELFVQRIQKIMAGAPGDVFRLTFDTESDRALMLLPRYIVRQLPTIAPTIAKK
ncbi:MAG: hypothetical protein ACR2NZ_00970 [Rubripirellula sp.]